MSSSSSTTTNNVVGVWFEGIRRDFERRRAWYASDWVEGWNSKTTASVFFMFFTSIGPALTFAELLEESTDAIGVVEVCVSSALSGMIFSVFAGQPLCILGVTGPVSILTISISRLSKQLGVKFLPFYAWSQIFAALMHMGIAAFGGCDYIRFITNFSCHTFGLLIALIYLVTGVSGIATSTSNEFIIAVGTAGVALFLSKATEWPILRHRTRVLISDYAPTVSILFFAIIAKSDVRKLSVPSTFRTHTNRAWVSLSLDLPAWAIVASIIPGAIITILFVFDHNVSSILAQQFNLRKGSAYHLDFFVLGFCILVTGILKIPPCNGLIPQAPLHTKSLVVSDTNFCFEQRYTNFLQASMTGAVCFKPFLTLLGKIPKSCLDGLFVFMALSSLPGNELWDRFVLWVSEPARRASTHNFFSLLDFSVIAKFTKLQICAVVLIYAVTLTPIAMTFPLFIAALVYVRTRILPNHFDLDALLILDPLIDLGDHEYHHRRDDDDEEHGRGGGDKPATSAASSSSSSKAIPLEEGRGEQLPPGSSSRFLEFEEEGPAPPPPPPPPPPPNHHHHLEEGVAE
ncbi:hypothetical protein CTAYLR_005161 [Chrysophaeum taylorii]|uniref:Bicarbonate transporter-like transmembrane domain-containing protein n=1 Tax=Chrysophaeum taylorii TaxID=2483200 RepID=A0AAD7UMZ3_9STRA|nr:hypothetical protein CTAYLR_005161 [Chrysophaeum taylorii]